MALFFGAEGLAEGKSDGTGKEQSRKVVLGRYPRKDASPFLDFLLDPLPIM